MSECTSCGYVNTGDAKFCQSCWITLQNKTVIEFRKPLENDYDRPIQFTIVLVLQYIVIGLLGLISIVLLLIGLLTVLSSSALGTIVFLLVMSIPLLIAGLMFWLTYEVQNYINTARIIMIVLYIINFIITIINFTMTDLVGIAIIVFVLYVLILDKRTVRLFEQ